MTSIAPELDTTEDELVTPPTADVATDGDDSPEPVGLFSDDEDDDDQESAPVGAEGEAPAAEPEQTTPEPDASASTPPEPEEAAEPVTLDYEGGSYTVPHAFFNHTRNSLDFKDVRGAQRAHTLMKHGAWYEAVGRKQLETLEKRVTTEVEAARAEAKDFLDALMGSAELPQEQFVERMLAFREQAPELRHQMTVADYERRLAAAEGRTKQPDAFPEPPQEHLTEWAESETLARIDRDAASGQFPWMSAECVAELKATLADPARVSRYVKTATPEIAQQHGLRIGQPYFDPAAFYADARPIAKAWEVAHGKMSAAKVDAAKQVQTLGQKAQTNSKILAQAKPAAKAAAATAPTPKREPTRAEMEAEIARARAELRTNAQRSMRRDQAGRFL